MVSKIISEILPHLYASKNRPGPLHEISPFDRPKVYLNARSTLTQQVIKNLLVQCIVAAIKISFPDQTRDKGQLK